MSAMNIIDKMLRWPELHMRLRVAEQACESLAERNGDLSRKNFELRIENERLRSELHGEGE